MNKKAYLLFITLILLSSSSYIFINILKNTNLKNTNEVKILLNKQNKVHLKFLEEYLLNTNLKDITEVLINNDTYKIYATIKNNTAHLFVEHKFYKISSYKKIFLKTKE